MDGDVAVASDDEEKKALIDEENLLQLEEAIRGYAVSSLQPNGLRIYLLCSWTH